MTEQALRSQLTARNALLHVEQLCELGDRFIGQDGDDRALAYVEAWFTECGLELERTPIEVPSFRELCCSLQLADGTELDAIAPYFSPSTEGTLEADAVFLGDGEDADYVGVDLDGKIAVLEETGLGYSKFWLGGFAARARDHGARAVIVVHPMPWPYRMSMEAGNATLANRFIEPRIPAATVSAGGGLRLLQAIGRKNGTVSLTVETELEQRRSTCLAGVRRGTVVPEERVVILAHRDHGLPPGANDNGSGTATMLELARVLATEETERSLVFLSSTAEEGVTEGIAQYIASLGADVEQTKAVFDLDMFAVGGRLNLVDEGHWPDAPPLRHSGWLNELIEDVAAELGYHLGRMTATWGVAESGRFLEAGVPAAWFWKPDDLYYHSRHDSPDKIDANLLKVVGDITMTAALRVANREVAR